MMMPPWSPGLWACSASASAPVFLAAVWVGGAVSELTARGASLPESEQPTKTAALTAARASRAESMTTLRSISILLGDQKVGKSRFGRDTPGGMVTRRPIEEKTD